MQHHADQLSCTKESWMNPIWISTVWETSHGKCSQGQTDGGNRFCIHPILAFWQQHWQFTLRAGFAQWVILDCPLALSSGLQPLGWQDAAPHWADLESGQWSSSSCGCKRVREEMDCGYDEFWQHTLSDVRVTHSCKRFIERLEHISIWATHTGEDYRRMQSK